MVDSNKQGSSHDSGGPAANGAAQRRRAGIYVPPDSIEARWAADIARQGVKESADKEAEGSAEVLRKISQWTINEDSKRKG